MTKPERAIDLFARRFNCSQAIFAAYGPDEGLDERRCLMIAAPFGGGIARLGETCGAVTGAIMVLGLRHGGPAATDPAAKAAMYELACEFMTRFKARNNTIVCRELLGCDVSTPEGRQQAEERKLHETLCVKYVRDAAEILDNM